MSMCQPPPPPHLLLPGTRQSDLGPETKRGAALSGHCIKKLELYLEKLEV